MFGLGPCGLMIPSLVFIIWLVIVVYVLTLVNRLVNAVEKIAHLLEKKQ